MSQSGMFENYGLLLDAADMWNFSDEALRVEEPEGLETNPTVGGMESDYIGANGDGDDDLEDFEANPIAEGIELDHVGDNDDNNNGRRQKKKVNRHTQYQTQQLLAFFEKHPRPTRKQREELAQAIGLTYLQVKFWCQNKRNTLKGQRKSKEITRLKAEIEELRAKNAKYKEALGTTCLGCGGEMNVSERLLIAENARLKDEIRKVFAIASKHIKKPPASTYPHLSSSSLIPQQYQAQSTPIRPAPMPSEGTDPYHPEWNHRISELIAMTNRSNPGAPSYSPHNIGDPTLLSTDPQDRTS